MHSAGTLPLTGLSTRQDVEFQVDSYPHRVFSGKVVRIFPSPEIKNNVVTYVTEIRVSNHDLALTPGMTANVTIILATKDEVLIAPNIDRTENWQRCHS